MYDSTFYIFLHPLAIWWEKYESESNENLEKVQKKIQTLLCQASHQYGLEICSEYGAVVKNGTGGN